MEKCNYCGKETVWSLDLEGIRVYVCPDCIVDWNKRVRKYMGIGFARAAERSKYLEGEPK